MATVIAEHELFDSCRILFGSELQVTRSFLEYLQRSGIKSAYRKKALETHPDILASQGETAATIQSAELFRLVQQSYENLSAYLDARDNGFRFQIQRQPPVTPRSSTQAPPGKPAPRQQGRPWSPPNHGHARATAGGQTDPRRQGRTQQGASCQSRPSSRPLVIPCRKLLFGHFLFYAGVTNWQTIIKALVWQRTGRPRLGEIGRRFGWLTDQDILSILQRRSLSASFGASALALGLLNERQLKLMLFQQNRLQKRFGEYFIHHKLLTPTQVNELVHQFSRHNTSFERQRHPFAARM